MTDIADYIVAFYDSARLHPKRGNQPPNAIRAASGNETTYRGVRENLTTSMI
jgi:hypothetical protein